MSFWTAEFQAILTTFSGVITMIVDLLSSQRARYHQMNFNCTDNPVPCYCMFKRQDNVTGIDNILIDAQLSWLVKSKIRSIFIFNICRYVLSV